jgi:hypothetical protein
VLSSGRFAEFDAERRRPRDANVDRLHLGKQRPHSCLAGTELTGVGEDIGQSRTGVGASFAVAARPVEVGQLCADMAQDRRLPKSWSAQKADGLCP